MRDYAKVIGSLIARAEHPNTPPAEAEAAKIKAEELMREYHIAEEEALAVDPGSILPVTKVVILRSGSAPISEMSNRIFEVFSTIANHCGIRHHIRRTDDWGVEATLVGYEGDVRYAEFLWTASHLMFSTRIDPSWSPERSEDENIFLLRQSGVERRRIADQAWGNGNEAAARSKVQRIYLRECARRGEEPLATGLGFTTSTYRESYADSFLRTLSRRLRNARDAANSATGLPVHHGRQERIDEAFYAVFPNLRPDTRPVPVADTWVDPRTNCAKCAKAKSGACNDHSYMRARAWTAEDERRAWQRENGASARAGRGAGRMAAEGVNVTRGHTTENRLDRANGALEG